MSYPFPPSFPVLVPAVIPDILWNSSIQHAHGEFFVAVLGGSQKLLDAGWYYKPGPGGVYCYGTKGHAAVKAAVSLGATLEPEASDALWSAPDDPVFAREKERERLAFCAHKRAEREEEGRKRAVLVESARGKLTAEEFDAVYAAGGFGE